jgi:hypothetical protein
LHGVEAVDVTTPGAEFPASTGHYGQESGGISNSDFQFGKIRLRIPRTVGGLGWLP